MSTKYLSKDNFQILLIWYFKKILGGTRSWTMDLSICSRMLYHWAIPPHISTKVLECITISMPTKVYIKKSSGKYWSSPSKKFRGHTELNHGPLDLQSNALPLSYTPSYIEERWRISLHIDIYKKPNKIKFRKSLIRSFKRILGGTRSWTMDLSICSRMLYHWAIPPHIKSNILHLFTYDTCCSCMSGYEEMIDIS